MDVGKNSGLIAKAGFVTDTADLEDRRRVLWYLFGYARPARNDAARQIRGRTERTRPRESCEARV